MIRFSFAGALLAAVLWCAPPCASAADWLEPGVYPPADSQGSGEIHAFGSANDLGDRAIEGLADLAAMASSRSGAGYWVSNSVGKVFAFGDAVHRGDLRSISLDAPVVLSLIHI